MPCEGNFISCSQGDPLDDSGSLGQSGSRELRLSVTIAQGATAVDTGGGISLGGESSLHCFLIDVKSCDVKR